MSSVLEFISKKTRTRLRAESLIKDNLYITDGPETRDKKIRATMDTLDRYSPESGLIPLSVNSPAGEPFSDAQLECIVRASEGVRESLVRTIQSAELEIILLKIAVIDMEAS